jgi:hypothetical protein
MLPMPLACGMVLAEKMPRGSIFSKMVFNKIGKGGSGEKARLAWLACTIFVELFTWNQKDFFCSSSGKFSSAAATEGPRQDSNWTDDNLVSNYF